MSDVVHAELPADLSAELINEGFEEYIAFRGLAEYAGAVVTVASASLAAGANAATIVVSRDAITGFVAAIRAWARRKASGRPHGELKIDISATEGDTRRRLRLEIASENGTPEIDTDALTAFITSLFTDKHGAARDITSSSSKADH